MLTFAISAVRALVEMLGLCLIGQGVLYLMAGQKRRDNAVYALLALVTRPVRQAVAMLIRSNPSSTLVGLLSFGILFFMWIGLAIVRKFI